jgi:DNA polymerase (family X)
MLTTKNTVKNTVTKHEVIAQLGEIATLLDVLGEDAFRAKSYANAARQLEAFGGDFETLFAEDKLTSIRGIGKSLVAELATLKTQELMPLLQDLHERVPQSVRGLFRVSGLGAKKVALLWQNGITDIQELIEAAEDGRLANFKGFGKKSAENFHKAAEFVLHSEKRMRLDVATTYANLIMQVLKENLPDIQVSVSGSLRRCLETIGNLNFVVYGVTAPDVAKALESIAEIKEVSSHQVSAQLEGRDIYITIVEPKNYGAVLAYQTGNYEYREMLLERASEFSFELRDDGLYKLSAVNSQPSAKSVQTLTEQDFFETLQLPHIEPELREEKNPKAIAKLIEFKDVRGLVHNHSTWSDAQNSIREMVQAARERGYAYLAMGDHSRTSYYANGLSIERVYAQAKEIAEIREELKAEGSDFELLHGLEVDILSDGSLDYPDDVLATLDYAVVSVHQNFTLSEADQTKRIIRAVQNPYAKILGHATGRILLRRPSYALDIQAVIEACAETKTVVEINASSYRLDLDWRWVIKAKELGCTFSINPDAHVTTGFDDVPYGVMMARKAGLTPGDVVNTAATGKAFLSKLKS